MESDYIAGLGDMPEKTENRLIGVCRAFPSMFGGCISGFPSRKVRNPAGAAPEASHGAR